MSTEKLLSFVQSKVEEKLAGVTDPGHDIWHIKRVWHQAKAIYEIEGGDLLTIELAALLHDLVDDKFFEVETAIIEIRGWLNGFEVPLDTIENVISIITTMSFSKEIDGTKLGTLESRIVQDADRLDAVGAIGIARAFSYGSRHQRSFFDPAIFPAVVSSKETYRKSYAPTINHFFDKLLKLKSMMKTETGKQLAEQRTQFLVMYLKQFFNEFSVMSNDELSNWNQLLLEFNS